MAKRKYPRKPLDEKRVEKVLFLLTPSERQKLDAMAERANKTLSEVIRENVFDSDLAIEVEADGLYSER